MGFLPLFEFLLGFIGQWIVLTQISTFGELQLGKDLPILVCAGVSNDVVNELQGDDDNAIVIGNNDISRENQSTSTGNRTIY